MGYRQILSQLVEVKGLQSIVKIVINILEGQTLQMWEGGGFDGRRPKSSNKHKKYQKQRQQQAATGTSNKKSSNTQQNQEQHKQHKQQPRKSQGQEVWVPKVGGGRASPRGISVVFEAFFFFWIQAKICNNWSLTFSEVLWGANLL